MNTKEHIQYHKDGSIWAKGIGTDYEGQLVVRFKRKLFSTIRIYSMIVHFFNGTKYSNTYVPNEKSNATRDPSGAMPNICTLVFLAPNKAFSISAGLYTALPFT